MFRKLFSLLERMVRALEAIANRPLPKPDLTPATTAIEQLRAQVTATLGEMHKEEATWRAGIQQQLVDLRERSPPNEDIVKRVGVLEIDTAKDRSLLNSVKSAFYRSQEGKRRDRADEPASFVLPGGLVPIGGGPPRAVPPVAEGDS